MVEQVPKDKDFIDISKELRQVPNIPISGTFYKQLVEAPTMAEILLLLQKNAPFLTEVHSPEEIEECMLTRLEHQYHWIYEHITHPIVVDVLSVRYEYENLKNALFCYFSASAEPPRYLETGRISRLEYSAFLEHQDPFKSELPDYLLNPARQAIAALEQNTPLEHIQQQLQKQMYAHMLTLAGQIQNTFITDFVGSMIDFQNAITAVTVKALAQDIAVLEKTLIPHGKSSRGFFVSSYTNTFATCIPSYCHKQFPELVKTTLRYYEETQDLQIFHHMFRHIQNQMAEKAELLEYGAEIPFAYLLRAEYSISQIRTILYQKTQQTPTGQTMAYLGLQK